MENEKGRSSLGVAIESQIRGAWGENGGCSLNRSAIRLGEHVRSMGEKWALGDSSKVKLCADDWTGHDPLVSMANGPWPQHQLGRRVAEVLTEKAE